MHRNALTLLMVATAACGPNDAGDTVDSWQPLLELDHVFVVVPGPTGAMEALSEAGITVDEMSLTRHEGQGTASVSAAFGNAYLELLWVDSTVSLAEGARDDIASLDQASSWQARAPSPFGIGLRRRTPSADPLPYEGEVVEGQAWVEEGETFFRFDTDAEAPLVFVVPDYMALTSWIDQLRADAPGVFDHASGVNRLTSVRVEGAKTPPSFAAANLDGITFENTDAQPLLHLTFDDGTEGLTFDLRPKLPVAIHR